MKYLLPLILVLACTSKDSNNNNQSCSIETISNGAIISCPDGTSSVIVNEPIEDDDQEEYPVAQPIVNITNICHYHVIKLRKKWLLFNKYKFLKFLKHGKHVIENCEINVEVE